VASIKWVRRKLICRWLSAPDMIHDEPKMVGTGRLSLLMMIYVAALNYLQYYEIIFENFIPAH